jgi:V/A-type H+-transporting ATPase subunit I
MIVPIKKAKLFVFNEDKDKALKIIQKKALMMTTSVENAKIEDVSFEDDVLVRTQKAIKYLEVVKGKKGFFEYHQIDEASFETNHEVYLDFLTKVEDKEVKLTKINEDIEHLNESIADLTPFNNLSLNLEEINKANYVKFFSGFVHEKNLDGLKELLTRNDISYELFDKDDRGYGFIVALYFEDYETYINEIKRFDVVKFNLPIISRTATEYLIDLTNQKSVLEEQQKDLQNEIFALSQQIEELYILADQMSTTKKRKLVPYFETERTSMITGWVRSDQAQILEEALKANLEFHELELTDPLETETPPTALKNNKFVSSFETITESYNVPNHKEIDPNPLMSIWYWLIFGIMMGDIGYGLMMVIGFGLFLKYKRPKGTFKQLVTVFYYSGYTSILVGILFGSLFGTSFDLGNIVGSWFGQNWTSVVLVPMDQPLEMLIISLIIGVIHILSGLVMKVILSIKLKTTLDGLTSGLSWILILVGLGIYIVFSTLITNQIIGYIGLGMIGLGALIILLFAGYQSKSVFGKIGSGLGGLYGATSYLSDILSYSRILALSLSTAVIAFTFNLLASMFLGNVFGFIIAILIYLIGHIFNFAMGLLSAYIHDSRLQYIEFFSKFLIGEGYKYEPLSVELNYIDEIKQTTLVGGN